MGCGHRNDQNDITVIHYLTYVPFATTLKLFPEASSSRGVGLSGVAVFLPSYFSLVTRDIQIY